MVGCWTHANGSHRLDSSQSAEPLRIGAFPGADPVYQCHVWQSYSHFHRVCCVAWWPQGQTVQHGHLEWMALCRYVLITFYLGLMSPTPPSLPLIILRLLLRLSGQASRQGRSSRTISKRLQPKEHSSPDIWFIWSVTFISPFTQWLCSTRLSTRATWEATC